MPTGERPFTTAMRMRIRIHRRTAHRRSPSEPAPATRLAHLEVAVIGVAHLANGRQAGHQDPTHLAAGQAQLSVVAFLRQHLSASPRGAGHLAAAAGLQLDVVHHGAERNVAQGQCIADPNLGFGARHDLVADLEANRRQDVALLAVCIGQQGNTEPSDSDRTRSTSRGPECRTCRAGNRSNGTGACAHRPGVAR